MISKIRQTSIVPKISKTEKQSSPPSTIDKSLENKLFEGLSNDIATNNLKVSTALIETKLVTLTLTNMLGPLATKEPKYKELHQKVKQLIENSSEVKTLVEIVYNKLQQ